MRKQKDDYSELPIGSGCFEFIKSPFLSSSGGIFVWIDLSWYLNVDSDEAEIALWMNIYKQTGVLLTPGKEFKHPKKGLFRMVFTSVSFLTT